MKTPTITEDWIPVPRWPTYVVSRLGHIKHKRGKRPVPIKLDTTGFSTVTLKSGKRELDIRLDTLILGTISGVRKLNPARRVMHLDGVAWNNWAYNLAWQHEEVETDGLVATWTVRHEGKLQNGPFTDHGSARAAAQWIGDIIIGRDNKRNPIAYEVKIMRGADNAPENPIDLADYLDAQAKLHANQGFSADFMRAAAMIRTLAKDNFAYNTKAPADGWPVTALRPKSDGQKIAEKAIPIPASITAPRRRRVLITVIPPKAVVRRRALITA